MYTPSSNRFPSAVAAILAAAVMTFMTVAPEAENRASAADIRIAETEASPSGVCIERAFVGCEPIRA